MTRRPTTSGTRKGGGWLNRFHGTMAASAFAEANVHGYARRVMDKDSKVVLVIDGNELDERPLKYAITLCKNTGASLSLLQVNQKDHKLYASRDARLQPSAMKLLGSSDVRYSVESIQGSLQNEVMRFIKRCRGVISIVMKSPEGKSIRKATMKKMYQLQGISCPLVII